MLLILLDAQLRGAALDDHGLFRKEVLKPEPPRERVRKAGGFGVDVALGEQNFAKRRFCVAVSPPDFADFGERVARRVEQLALFRDDAFEIRRRGRRSNEDHGLCLRVEEDLRAILFKLGRAGRWRFHHRLNARRARLAASLLGDGREGGRIQRLGSRRRVRGVHVRRDT